MNPNHDDTWSGGYVNGKAFGEGRLVFWRGSDGPHIFDGSAREGKLTRGTLTFPNGISFEVDWRD